MISVVIPTRNRADLLAPALESILTQDLAQSRFEVLVIDNGSTDDTQHVIDQYKGQLANLSGIYAPEPGLHTGRHVGMKVAKGDILVFVDDDIESLPTWLSSIDTSFQDPQVAMVGGNNYPLFLQTPPDWLNRMWHRPTFRGYKSIPSLSVIEFTQTPKVISPYQIWGCNFAIRKEVLLQAGGFHPDGMPKELIRFRGDGETHVSRYVAKSDLKCVFHPGASVYHKVTQERMTHAYFRQRGFNQGVSDSYTQLRQDSPPASSFRFPLIHRVFSFALRKTIHLFDSAELKRAAEALQLGHREGYAYHQTAYREDPEVREWVHKPIYF
jgi:glucosyl-dolichyl phosphate glucuronosyltransferase